MFCCDGSHRPISRRQMLTQAANGFGAVALTSLLTNKSFAHSNAIPAGGILKEFHHPPRARSVIFLYMDGGPSQLDTFDPKPRLDREHGQPIKLAKVPATQFDNVGTVLKSPWKFSQHGECGLPVSELFPNVATCIDDLAIIRSMVSNFSEHTFANYFLHTGSGLQGRPSMGSWVTYGLGTECDELPGYVVLDGGLIPRGGTDNFHSGFLPATYQGSIFKTGAHPVANIQPADGSLDKQRQKLRFISELDQGFIAERPDENEVEAAIANYELAFRMQSAVPSLMNIDGETKETWHAYGLDHSFPPTQIYGRLCLIARRLVERGVRFIELTCPSVGADRWDQHSNLKDGHQKNSLAVDQPIAALLKDLKARGLLDETLVVWAGEFGRTPMAQGSDGRDHNPFGFTIWMAGGGIKGGMAYGATDDYGYFAIENKVMMHDMHATMLHLLGIDHKRLTFRFSSRDMRLTDVHGNVVHDIIA